MLTASTSVQLDRFTLLAPRKGLNIYSGPGGAGAGPTVTVAPVALALHPSSDTFPDAAADRFISRDGPRWPRFDPPPEACSLTLAPILPLTLTLMSHDLGFCCGG